MSDDQKIWFIYLTDHHEGPFTAAEIAEKAKAGLVSGQSLAWKDGMPEWVAAETIPELAGAMGGGGGGENNIELGGSVTTPAPSPSIASDGEVSLAQLLANSQGGGPTTNTVSGQIIDSASVLSSQVSSVQAATPTLTQTTGVSLGGGSGIPTSSPSGASSGGGAEPGPDHEVWTLKIGGQVSGLHSIRKLKELASGGEIPPDAMVWHPGWSDFQPAASVAQLESALKSKGGGGARLGSTRTGITKSSVGIAMSAGADPDDEPTDTGLIVPPKGFQGVLFKIHTFFEKLKKKNDKKAATKAATKAKGLEEKTQKTTLTGKTKALGVAKKAGAASSMKRIATLLGVLAVLGGGGGAAWYFLMSSPIPSTLDVSDEDRDTMTALVQSKDGKKLFLANAKGTDENPPDPNAPKYYVVSNLPENTMLTLTATGVPGTLVNRLGFEKSFTASVDKAHIATFDKVSDDGKPLWGEFEVKVTADGAEPLDAGKKFIGMKGAAYQKRLKTYKDNVQGDYDKEIQDLREYISTVKNLQVEASKEIADYKANWAVPASRGKIITDWAAFGKNSQALITQLDATLKARQAGDKAPKYHARAFQDVSTTVGQLDQLVRVHSERLTGATPTANADELDGLVQAGVQALEAWLATAVSKTPFDAHTPDAVKPTGAAAPAPTAAAPVPAKAAAAPAPAAAPAAPAAPAAAKPAAPAPAAPGGAH